MAYFSNGCEGDDYEATYCRRCIHGDGEGAGSCAVMLAHLIHNYKECNNKESILHMLIPRSKSGLGNEQCLMFLEDPDAPDPRQADMFDGEARP